MGKGAGEMSGPKRAFVDPAGRLEILTGSGEFRPFVDRDAMARMRKERPFHDGGLDHPPRLFLKVVDDRLICEAGGVFCQCAASRHSPIKKKARADRERRPRDSTQSQAGRSCHRGLRRQTLFYESMNPTAA